MTIDLSSRDTTLAQAHKSSKSIYYDIVWNNKNEII